MEHTFKGKWISNSEFADLKPRNVFHKQLDPVICPVTSTETVTFSFAKSFTAMPLPCFDGLGTKQSIRPYPAMSAGGRRLEPHSERRRHHHL